MFLHSDPVCFLQGEMLCPIIPGADAIYVLECPGKMQLVRIADHCADGADGESAFGQQLCCTSHAVVQKKSLWVLSHGVPEDLAEIAAVQAAKRSDILDRDILSIVLLDKRKGFLHVEVTQTAWALCLMGSGGLDELI